MINKLFAMERKKMAWEPLHLDDPSLKANWWEKFCIALCWLAILLLLGGKLLIKAMGGG